jgi:general stress protein 26
MVRVEDERDTTNIGRLLAGATKTIASVRYCWLMTEPETGGANVRPMGRISPVPDGNDWTLWLLADGRSRKISDIRRANRVALILQHEPDDAFVTLIGSASLHQGPSEVCLRWKDAYDAYLERANATLIEVEVERMELWIRGVTPEPFGLHPTIIERDVQGAWRLLPGDRSAA